ncbi:radical SAM protein [Desulfococcaceae bacterium HSG8]|nr:radical SAM protein [Desulfococcaceae bacterium HSG8]
MPKAIFIVPSPEGLVAKGSRKFHRRFPPLSMLITASMLRDHGWEVMINDLNADPRLWPEQSVRNAESADVAVMTTNPYADWQCPSYAIRSVLDFARQLPLDRLVVTGNQGSLYPGAVLNETGARIVVRDEPEQTVFQAALALNKGSDLSQIDGISYRYGEDLRHNPRRQLSLMDEFPPPAYDLINLEDYYYELLGGNFALLETSRGCPYACNFCNQSMFQNRYRKRTVGKFLQEADTLVETHGCRSLYIFDLEFTINSAAVRAVCDHLIQKGYARHMGFRWACQTRADSVDEELLELMKQSGCALIHFGVETGNAEILTNTRKKIRKQAIRRGIQAAKNAGIQTAGFFMFGLPGETTAHFRETIEFALELNPTFASFHPLLPIPGSPLFEEKYGKGPYWNEPLPWDRNYFTRDQEKEISRFVRAAYLRYYLRPRYIAGLLMQGDWRDYLRQFKLFLAFALQK